MDGVLSRIRKKGGCGGVVADVQSNDEKGNNGDEGLG
jgi:hypothetical protein